MSEKYKIHDAEGIYFVTLTIVFWIDIFTRKELKHVIIDALQYAQKHKGLVIHAWCIMSSHLHLMISSQKEQPSAILRDFKKYTNRQIIKTIGEINESRKDWLLRAFNKAGQNLKRIKTYKVWQDGNHPILLDTNVMMEQRLDYIHQNPVANEIVDEASSYLYSSARDYEGLPGLLKINLVE